MHLLRTHRPTGPRGRIAPVLAALLAAAAGAATLRADAALVCSPQGFDLGEVATLATNVVVELLNTGDEAIELAGVETDCPACLRWSLSSRRIAPGGRARLDVTLDLERTADSFRHTLTVRTAGPRPVTADIAFSGSFLPLFSVAPRILRIEVMEPGQEGLAQVLVQPKARLRAPLAQVAATVDWIEAWLVPEPDSVTQRVYVRPSASLAPGLHVTSLRVTSPDPLDPPCTVPVQVYVRPELEVLPPELALESDNAPQRRLLFVRQHGESPRSVVDVLLPCSTLSCEVYAEPTRPWYRITVDAWDLGGRTGSIGDISIVTDGRREPGKVPAEADGVVRVPVYVGPHAEDVGTKGTWPREQGGGMR